MNTFDRCVFFAVDSGEILTGRPYGRLLILWRKSIDSMRRVMNFDDKRLFGLKMSTEERILIANNTYFPYYSANNIDKYLFYIVKFSSTFETFETCGFFALSDLTQKFVVHFMKTGSRCVRIMTLYFRMLM